MKSTKMRLLAMLLALAMVLCACGADPEDVSGEITPAPTVPADMPEEEPQEQPADVPTEPPTEAPAEEENSVSLGRMEGGVYTNTYAGFGCELDESWTVYTAEELQKLPEKIYEAYGDTELGKAAGQPAQIVDMMAENVIDLTGVNITYTQIPMHERWDYLMMSEEETVDTALFHEDMIIEANEQAGIEDLVIEKVTFIFLGEEHVGIKGTATNQGVPYYYLQVVDYTLGAYGMNLTAFSYVEDNTQAVLDLFYAVD